MVRTISNNHIRQTILIVIESPLVFRTFFNLNTIVAPIATTQFLSHYDVSFVKFPFLPLLIQLCPFPNSFPFLYGSHPLFVSFLVFMKGSVSKEKVEKMLRS